MPPLLLKILCKSVSKISRNKIKKSFVNIPGSFLVLKEAFVIIDFETVTVVVAGVKATLIPIGPSLG